MVQERMINLIFRDSLVAKKDMRPRSDSEVATIFVKILIKKTLTSSIPGAAAKHQEGDADHPEGRVQGQV